MAEDFDVIIDMHTSFLPFAELIAFGEQGLEGWPVGRLVLRAARARQFLDGAHVEIVEQAADGVIEIVEYQS